MDYILYCGFLFYPVTSFIPEKCVPDVIVIINHLPAYERCTVFVRVLPIHLFPYQWECLQIDIEFMPAAKGSCRCSLDICAQVFVPVSWTDSNRISSTKRTTGAVWGWMLRTRNKYCNTFFPPAADCEWNAVAEPAAVLQGANDGVSLEKQQGSLDG